MMASGIVYHAVWSASTTPIGKQCFIPPWHLANEAASIKIPPVPVNNQIRGVRKSLSCSRKRHRWRGQARGTRGRGTQRGKIPPILFANYRGSALLDSDIYAQMFERHACADIQLKKEFKFNLRIRLC